MPEGHSLSGFLGYWQKVTGYFNVFFELSASADLKAGNAALCFAGRYMLVQRHAQRLDWWYILDSQ